MPPPDRKSPRRLRSEGGRGGGRWAGWLTPLATSAAVAAVIATALAISGCGRSPGPGEGAALARVPPYYLALTGHPRTRRDAVIRATDTGRILARVVPPHPYGTFIYLSAAADDRTFVLAAQRWWTIPGRPRSVRAQMRADERDTTTPLRFFLLRFDPSSGKVRLALLSLRETLAAVQVGGIGLSPDGGRLALALRAGYLERKASTVRHPEIQVIMLSAGTIRTWVWPNSSGWLANWQSRGAALSWSEDGRMLVFQYWPWHETDRSGSTSVYLLDTSKPGSDLATSRRVMVLGNISGFTTSLAGENTMITPDGTKIVAGTFKGTDAARQAAIREFSTRTGRVVRILDQGQILRPGDATPPKTALSRDVLWTDPSGDVLITTRGPHDEKIGLLTGNRFTPLPGAPRNTVDAVW